VKIWLLALDYRVWATNPLGFHLMATALFAINLVLIALVARRLIGEDDWTFPLLAAFTAAVHPVFAEVVPFITAREEILASAFALAALHAFLRHRQAGAGIAPVCVFLALALLSKESGIVAPLLLGGYDLAAILMVDRSLRGARTRARSHLFPAIIVAAYFFLRTVAFGSPVGGWGESQFGSIRAFLRYHVHFSDFLVHRTMFAWHAVPGIEIAAVVLGIAGLVLVVRRRARLGRPFLASLLFAGPVWYLATAVPNYGTYFSPRHQVLPIIGLALFASLLLRAALVSFAPSLRRALAGAAALALAAALVPPGQSLSREFDVASRTVQGVRERVERETADLVAAFEAMEAEPVVDVADETTSSKSKRRRCRVKLISAPIFDMPPYYFGWGLQSALSLPFTRTDLANRCRVVSGTDLRINKRSMKMLKRFDAVIHLDLVPPPTRGADWSD
jgi:hypothetical protein